MLKTTLKVLIPVALAVSASIALTEKSQPEAAIDEVKPIEKSAHWLTDMDEAQKIAKAEGKDIFMFFTGSDWCGWCIRLDDEVLSQEAFLTYAEDNLVLVELDFPNDQTLITEEQMEHNKGWRDTFKPRGYPSVYLTNNSADAYALTGYQDGGANSYIEHLQQLQSGQEATKKLQAKASQATGLKRAQLLDQLLSNQHAIVSDTDSKAKEILTLAKGQDDVLFNKYNGMVLAKEVSQEIRNIDKGVSKEDKLEQMLTIFDKYSKLGAGENLQRLLGMIGDQFIGTKQGDKGVTFMQGIVSNSDYSASMQQSAALFKGIINMNTSGAQEATLEYLDYAIKMDPNSQSGQRAKTMKDSMTKDIAAVL